MINGFKVIRAGLVATVIISSGFAEEAPIASREMRLISDVANLYRGRTLQQLQYEMDLDNGVLWVWLAQFSGNNFLLQRGALGKEAIVAFQEGKDIPFPQPDMGYAQIGGERFVLTPSMKWDHAKPSDPHLPLERFDYVSLNTSYDFASALRVAERIVSTAKTTGDAAKISAARNIFDNLVSSKKERSFKREPFDIKVIADDAGNITSWNVLKEGVVYRRILNNVVPFQQLSLPNIPQKLSVNAEGGGFDDIYRALGDKPSVGAFLLRNTDGAYYIAHIVKNSPAETAGLKKGDRIEMINGTVLKGLSAKQLADIITENQELTFTINLGDENGFSEKKIVKAKLSL